jgi:deoxycytidylate deaminase
MSPAENTTAQEPEGSELVIAFVAAIGVNLTIAEEALSERLKYYNYQIEEIKVTRDVLPKIDSAAADKFDSSFDRIMRLMDLGNQARKAHGHDILAKGVASEILLRRKEPQRPRNRTAYIIHSLKHPEEVRQLRELYPGGFHLIGVHAHPDMRRKHLRELRSLSEEQIEKLMDRDKKESDKNGQQLNDTFHLADFFIGWSGDDQIRVSQQTLDLGGHSVPEDAGHTQVNKRRVVTSMDRFVDIIFGHRYKTPTFGEYAMFMAYSASLRSADLSRQVGAVIAKDSEILATGANDCPVAGGGLYWPRYNSNSHEIEDAENGRDYKREFDSNRREQDELIAKIMKSVVEKLRSENLDDGGLDLLKEILDESPIRNLTEYGRVVHAEMEALLACARKGVATKGATIYCTTFPCHNCAKHLIAAGIRRVVFVEPYLKSKAVDFHKDSIVINYPQDDIARVANGEKKDHRVKFEPFFGVGPRRLFDFFSMSLGAGTPMVRKTKAGNTISWDHKAASPRLQMQPVSYLELEENAARSFTSAIAKKTTSVDPRS